MSTEISSVMAARDVAATALRSFRFAGMEVKECRSSGADNPETVKRFENMPDRLPVDFWRHVTISGTTKAQMELVQEQRTRLLQHFKISFDTGCGLTEGTWTVDWELDWSFRFVSSEFTTMDFIAPTMAAGLLTYDESTRKDMLTVLMGHSLQLAALVAYEVYIQSQPQNGQAGAPTDSSDVTTAENSSIQLATVGEVPRSVCYERLGINDPVDAAVVERRNIYMQLVTGNELQRPDTPAGVLEKAKQISEDLFKLPSIQDRADALTKLASSDPQIHALVVFHLKTVRTVGGKTIEDLAKDIERLSPRMRECWKAANDCIDFPSKESAERFRSICNPEDVLLAFRALATRLAEKNSEPLCD